MKKSTVALLFLLTLVGLGLRLYNLDFQSLWTEEEYTAVLAVKSLKQIWSIVISTEFNPPGFFWVEHFAYLLWGYHAWVFRLPSVIAGTLLIPAMYFLGRDFKDEIAGMFCAGMTTVSYTLFYYSQFARAYSLSIFLFVLALIFFVRIRSGNTRHEYYLIFGLLTALNIWVHFYSIIPLILLWIILALRAPEAKHECWLAQGAVVSVCLCVPLLSMIITFIQGRLYASPELLPYGVSATDLLFLIPVEFFESTFTIFALLILMGIYVERGRSTVYELLSIGVITIFCGLLLTYVTPVYARYLLYVLPILFLISSCFFAEVLREKSDRFVCAGVLLFTALLFAAQYYAFIISYTVQQYQGIFL